jgi:hypothetical protein
VINIQVGYCWLWSLIIFLIQRFVSVMLGPHSLMGGVGGFPPHNFIQGGSRGGEENFYSPSLERDWGKVPPNRNFRKTFLVKYFIFIGNLDRSL